MLQKEIDIINMIYKDNLTRCCQVIFVIIHDKMKRLVVSSCGSGVAQIKQMVSFFYYLHIIYIALPIPMIVGTSVSLRIARK